MFRSVLALVAVVLACAGPAAASIWGTVWVVRDVHLRAQPDPDSRSRGLLYACDRVDVVHQIHDWVRVETDLGHGWVRARHLSEGRPASCRRHRPDPGVIVHPPVIVLPHPYPGQPVTPPFLRPWPGHPLDDWNRWHDW